MAKKNHVLAFDFGASSGRVILGKLVDKKIEMNEIHRFSNDPVKVGNTMYWDTLRQFHEIKQGMIKAKQQGGFDSLGIDTWGVDFGLLDDHDVLLENAIHYRDDRTLSMQEWVFTKLNKDRLYQLTGSQFENFNTIYQLASLLHHRPWLLERAKTLLLTPDLFNFFLTGKKYAEYTIASTTQLLDANRKAWSEEICQALAIPTTLFPKIILPGTVIGWLKDCICNELEIPTAKVIAIASHDTQSAVVSVPSEEKDFVFISCGTWSLFGTELKAPLMNETTCSFNLSNEGGYGYTTTLLKNIIGLWLVQESRNQWIKEGTDYGFGELEQLAKTAKPLVSLIDPDAPEFVASGNIPRRIAAFCERTGQPIPVTPGEIICCINQSLALKFRFTLEQIQQSTGKNYLNIHMIGGGTKSRLLCQMTANANGKKVIAGPAEATALGNIAVQLMALGEIMDIEEARKIIRNSEKTEEYFPEYRATWDEAYDRFKCYLG